MPHFTETLKEFAVSEWREKYIDYNLVKDHIIRHAADMRDDAPLLLQEDQEAEPMFASILRDEICKINDFYLMKLREYEDRFKEVQEALEFEAEIIPTINVDVEDVSSVFQSLLTLPTKALKKNKISKRIRKNIANLYRGLTLLENYSTINQMGIQKLLDKYDRMSGTSYGCMFKKEYEAMAFFTLEENKHMAAEIEKLYSDILFDGDLKKARNALSARRHGHRDFHMYFFGNMMGVTCVMIFTLLIIVVAQTGKNFPGDQFIAVLPVFRLIQVPTIGLFCWGIDVYIWHKWRVNHVFIFEFKPKTAMQYHEILTMASVFGAIFMVNVTYCYSYFVGTNIIPQINGADIFPVILVASTFCVFFCPFNLFWRTSRWRLARVFFSVIIAPFGRVGFREFFLGDVLTSLVKTMFDLEYTLCYFFSGDFLLEDPTRCDTLNAIMNPVFSVLPLFWRMAQCLRRYYETKEVVHLPNALKYAVGFSVVLFSCLMGNYNAYSPNWPASRILWLICFIGSTLYMYSWDIFMDWGLGRWKSRNPFLRNRLVWHEHKWVYYYCMVSNFFLRFFWTVTITPVPIYVGIPSEILNDIAATLEIIRRFQWAVLRLENEHLYNCGNFRAVKYVPVPFDHDHAPSFKDSKKHEPELQLKVDSALCGADGESASNTTGTRARILRTGSCELLTL